MRVKNNYSEEISFFGLISDLGMNTKKGWYQGQPLALRYYLFIVGSVSIFVRM